MAQGFITVAVSISGRALPISGAKVYVRPSILPRAGDISNRLLQYDNAPAVGLEEITPENSERSFSTDVDGKTPSIAFETPEITESLKEDSDVIPYSVFDIYIEAVGYISVRAQGVQIFPGVDSVLPVNLRPSSGSEKRIETFIIPENALVLPKPRSADFSVPSPDTAEPQIADRVYIPTTVAVHLGRPDDPAENVYVSFPDYIKNVASSEIYPTWPDAALRANIYAQISLALNRIYTEWYPSRGYDFQITNSTAFDQSFVSGRNIFNNISDIVDEIFNFYIKRERFREPLFAGYCDGVTVSCAGMSQWGSLYLAEQGNNAFRILNYYYGNNIELTSTDIIADIEESFPGEVLTLGDTSSEVAVIQRQLNRIRENYPSIPLIASVNGRFGSDTDLAVRAFQRIFSMPVTGKVDRATWYRISFIYTAVRELAELTSLGDAPIVPSSPPSVTLSRGSSGEEVQLLQYILDYIGLFYNVIYPVLIDGIFGSDTETAVSEFQSEFGLAPDGIVGRMTWDTLYRVYDGILETVVPKTPEQTYPGTPVELGDSGDPVRLIQRYLNAVRVRYPIIPAVTEDGLFGAETEIAIRAFQRRFGLSDDGVVGPLTWTRLVETYNFISSGLAVPTSAVTSSAHFPGITLRRGQRGHAIELLQAALGEYLSKNGSNTRLNVTGLFDASTEAAVAEYERRLGRKITGEVNIETWKELCDKYGILI